MHGWSMVDDRIAAVDDIVERCPLGITIVGGQVLIEQLLQVLVFVNGAGKSDDVLRTELAPYHHTTEYAIRGHLRITAQENTFHVVLLIPELVDCNQVLRLDLQEIATRTA